MKSEGSRSLLLLAPAVNIKSRRTENRLPAYEVRLEAPAETGTEGGKRSAPGWFLVQVDGETSKIRPPASGMPAV